MKKFVLGIILSSAASYVFAQDLVRDQKGWIVGAGVGTVAVSIKPINQPDLKSGKENAALFTVFGGYNFTHWFGIEFDISKSSNFKDKNTKLDAYLLGTSFTPKFTYYFNEFVGVYFKTGLQYVAYKQIVDTSYYDEITWNGIEPFLGTGFQYSFESGVRARIDYKYSKLTLNRSENSIFGFYLYDDEIDLSYSALTFTANYQF